ALAVALVVARGGGVSPAVASAAAPGAANFLVSGELTQGGWVKGNVPQGTTALTLAGKPVAFARDGVFFAAFDRDAPPTAVLAATLADGRSLTQLLTVTPRAWRIENINVARTPGKGPTEEFMRIRRPELARIAAARRVES